MIVRVDHCQQPGRAGIRREQLDHGGGSKPGFSKDSRPLAISSASCSLVMNA